MKYIENQPQFLRGTSTGDIDLFGEKPNGMGQQLLYVPVGQKQQ